MKTIDGIILFVDSVPYETALLKIALQRHNWDVKVEHFMSAQNAFEYLKTTRELTFLIISAMEMPGMTGMEFKKAIDTESALNDKGIPFIFMTNHVSKQDIKEAYSYRVQGYFKKPATINEQAYALDIIIQYWKISLQPESCCEL